MSASHAETASHGHESASSESVIETLGQGIGKIIDSVRIAISKTVDVIKGVWNDVFSSKGHGADHGGGHGTEVHAEAKVEATHPAPAHH